MNEDEKWMKIAIDEAILAKSDGEIPVGAVLIQNNKIIAKTHNQPISNHDPTAHAEVAVLREAGKKLKNYRLVGCTLYVTLEPCLMCLGAIIHARIERVVFGAFDFKTGVCGSCEDLTKSKTINHKVIISGGILENDCRKMLNEFFILRRSQKY